MVKTQTIKPPVQGGGDEMDIEMDASNQPAFSMMRPAFGESFPLPIVKSIMNNIMTEKLKDKTYDKNIAKTWTREIADEVNQQIATNSKVKRYKHVVQVMLGQELGAGATYLSRCCWDCDCDTSISEVFSNTSLFCVCTVYATFQY
ncbi:Dlc90F [Drosophila busckii]|uniref:Dlc90F n=2 Tax=Drosophila busckii TaxID=30019 RepID=A0A0M4F4U7_DROBS|nr:Dlc90F [Drosophila busckii]